MSSNPSLLSPIDQVDPRAQQSTTKSATCSENQSTLTRTDKKSFLLGGETPASRMSLAPSKEHSRKPSRQGSGQDLSTHFKPMRRSLGNVDDLPCLTSAFTALKAHAEERAGRSVDGRRQVSRNESSEGDDVTVQG